MKIEITKPEIIAIGRSSIDTSKLFGKVKDKMISDESIWEKVTEAFMKESGCTGVNCEVYSDSIVINIDPEFVKEGLELYGKMIVKAIEFFKEFANVGKEFKEKWSSPKSNDNAE